MRFREFSLDGLVGYWKMDEGTGTTTTDVFGNDGTLTATSWVVGKILGNALNFNGTTSTVSIADADALDLTSPFSIVFWANPNADNNGLVMRAVDKTGAGGGAGYLVSLNENGFELSVNNGVSGDALEAGAHVLPANTWSHGAATFNAGDIILYVNGVEDDRKTSTVLTAATTTAALTMGSSGTPSQYWNGVLDEVRLYNRALSAAEISRLYAAGRVVIPINRLHRRAS